LAITRVQVEGGFLDGLDIPVAPGMTVIVGGRGTGKTSLIELIRFCLDGGALTAEAAERGRSHAQAILQDGLVTVTLDTPTGLVRVSRAARDESPRTESQGTPPDELLRLSAAEFRVVVATYREALGLFGCDLCHGSIRLLVDGGGRPSAVQCDCGDVTWAL
jgi:hypothetical protein